MCAPSQGAMLPYGLKVPSPYFPFGQTGSLSQTHLSALDFQRSQLNDYNVRIQFGLRNYQSTLGLSPFSAYINDPYTQAYFYKHDPRARFVQEEPKPSHSYIGLIGMAILNSKEKKLVLSDIYQWILDNYPYFRTRGPGWRNSIRHNLSLNDCFIKAGRSANGKGHYWAVHPANVEDFERGDFRRRRAQRKVRRHMGLSVPDDEDSPTPSPTQPWPHHDLIQDCSDRGHMECMPSSGDRPLRPISTRDDPDHLVISHPTPAFGLVHVHPKRKSRKRLFDMASLLAPDDDDDIIKHEQQGVNGKICDHEIQVSGFHFHPIHEMKLKRKNDTPNGDDNNEINRSSEDVNVEVNSPSDSGKDMDDDSDDNDNENDEIHVTSGESSPALVESRVDDSLERPVSDVQDKSVINKLNQEEKNVSTKTDKNKETKWNSSPYKSESKIENALDLSSAIHNEGEAKNFDFYNKSYQSRIIGANSVDEGYDIGRKRITGIIRQEIVRKDTDFEYHNIYNDLKSASYSRGPKTSYKPQEQGGQINSEIILSNFSCYGRTDHNGQLSFVSRADLDRIKHEGNTIQVYPADHQELRRLHPKGPEDSSFIFTDKVLVSSDSRVPSDKMVVSSDNPVTESDARMERAEMLESTKSKERISAFTSLGTRNKCVYSPIQTRNYSVSNQRSFPAGVAMNAGVATPSTSVSSSSFCNPSSLIKGLDSVISQSKCNIVSNMNTSPNTTPITD